MADVQNGVTLDDQFSVSDDSMENQDLTSHKHESLKISIIMPLNSVLTMIESIIDLEKIRML